MTRHLLLAALVLAGLVISHPAGAQDKPFDAAQAAQGKRGLVWDNRPSIVFGEDINIDLRGRVQFDWRRFDPDVNEDTYDLRTLRFGLKGDLTRHFDWEIEREIDRAAGLDQTVDTWQLGEWKDVFLNWTTFEAFSIKGGRFKMPFGLEQTTSVSDLDFAFRALGSTKIAPGRDTGVMAYGELLGGSFVYEAGVFDDDGDNGTLEEFRFVGEGQSLEDLEDVGPSVAVRVVGEIFRRLPVHDRLKGAEFGIAFTWSHVPEGLNSLQGEEVWGYDFFERVYVNGRRQRLGLQFDWSPGPLGFKSEWMQSREARIGQSNRNDDLSDFVGTAWYTSATWIVTGEDKDSDVQPNDPLFGGGIGVVEVAVRYDRLTFESASKADLDFTNPRADHLTPNTDSTLTFGVNWVPVRWVKVVANALHQTFDDVDHAPLIGTSRYWSGLVRLQVAF
jgi:phosphate-selective porin OprO/OprP